MPLDQRPVDTSDRATLENKAVLVARAARAARAVAKVAKEGAMKCGSVAGVVMVAEREKVGVSKLLR